jgi:serine/threonine protein kinase
MNINFNSIWIIPKSCHHSFTIIKKLGNGVYGYVYKVMMDQCGKNCKLCGNILAAKISLELNKLKNLKHIYNEINILDKLKDIKNVVKFSHWENQLKRIIIFMELCDIDLYKYKGYFKFDVIFVDVLKALTNIHKCGVMHRDIKRENILLKNGKIRICDFGWSTLSKTSIYKSGTTGFNSPEQINNEMYDNSCDVWSFGCFVYDMLLSDFAFNNKKDITEYKYNLNKIPKKYHRLIQTIFVKQLHRPSARQILMKYQSIIKEE